MPKYHTTAAYISGGICGHMWMPAALAGFPIKKDLRGFDGVMDRFSEPATFRDALLSVLMSEGGDFQAPEFTNDTVIRVERKMHMDGGGYKVHVKEILVQDIEPDLINEDVETIELFGEVG